MVKPVKLNVDVEEEIPVSPEGGDLISPTGMAMRSGRKKRRRDKETSGLTPDKEIKKKRKMRQPTGVVKNKQASSSEGDTEEQDGEQDDLEMDDDDDDEMGGEWEEVDDDDDEEEGDEEEEVDDEEPQQEVPAVAAKPATPVAEKANDETAKKGVQRLRMPSEKTPGKPKARETQPPKTPYDKRFQGRVALEEIQRVEEPPSVTRVTQPAVPVEAIMPEPLQVDSPVRRLFRTIGTTIKEIIVPQAQDLDLDDDDELSQHTTVVNSRYFWIIIILLLQLVFYPIGINPIFHTVSKFADKSILFYKHLLNLDPTVIENITKVEVIVHVPSQPTKITKTIKRIIPNEGPASDNSEVIKHIEELAGPKDSFVGDLSNMERAKTDMTNQLDSVKSALLKKQESLKAWDAALSNVEEEIQEFFRTLQVTPPSEIPKAVKEREVSFKNLEDAAMMDVNTEIVSAEVPMWEVVSSTGCPQPPSMDNDPLISEQDIQEGSALLKQAAQETIDQTSKDPEIKEAVKEWVREELEDRDIVVDVDAEEDVEEEEDIGLILGVTEDEAKTIIGDRLEANLADTIGLLDVAARYNGGEVIRRGMRATTPSLVQSLPLLNRLMAATKLRFYGHGPEAALSPTIPPEALGQCWSFENIAKSSNPRWNSVYKRDKANGKYASLTIRLGTATTVKRVIIDHNSASDKDSSALRDFRVIGFTDARAAGEPIHLGTFRYEKEGAASQQFQITGAHDEIRSMTLAIDSTYSKDYACLYRFRVMEN